MLLLNVPATCSVSLRVAAVGGRCLTSQQHASVAQGRICSDKFTRYHTETEVADQSCYLTHSQYTDTGLTSSSADPITPRAWQDDIIYLCDSIWTTPQGHAVVEAGSAALRAGVIPQGWIYPDNCTCCHRGGSTQTTVLAATGMDESTQTTVLAATGVDLPRQLYLLPQGWIYPDNCTCCHRGGSTQTTVLAATGVDLPRQLYLLPQGWIYPDNCTCCHRGGSTQTTVLAATGVDLPRQLYLLPQGRIYPDNCTCCHRDESTQTTVLAATLREKLRVRCAV